AVCLSLVAIYLFGWLIYTLNLPNELAFGLMPLGLVGLMVCRRRLAADICDPLVRSLLIGQATVLVWNLCWLGVVRSYSGGGWFGDWYGHWQRCQFFLQRPDVNTLFNGVDSLPQRPPLVNVVVADWLAIVGNEFANYQLAMTAWSSLAFLPAAVLAVRAARSVPGGSPERAISLLAVFFMASPMAVQNATFAWTKLPAAVFTLAAVEFFLAARPWVGDGIRGVPAVLCGVCVAAALLSHYSAAPYAIVLAGVWLASGLRTPPRLPWLAATAAAGLAGALLLMTWFGWAIAVYGTNRTFFSNTTATDRAPTLALHAAAVAGNMFDTVVPHFLRSFDRSLIWQQSRWGYVRDWWFSCSQLNLFMTFGCVGWIIVLAACRGAIPRLSAGHSATWITAVGLVILLGIGCHSGRDHWGVAHICLQPLALAGLAFVAGWWPAVAVPFRWLFAVGAMLDLLVGILLHYAVQGFLIDRWLTPGRPLSELVRRYNVVAVDNYTVKSGVGWRFVGDTFAETPAIPFIIAAASLGFAVWQIRRGPRRD
ncbi:MAG: hypothetical protein EBX36_08695, partial [Planctomycetia bacterium]|nr:hypothetical protein [Planctomycetia bacterium]